VWAWVTAAKTVESALLVVAVAVSRCVDACAEHMPRALVKHWFS
jgi:hypothetical protein